MPFITSGPSVSAALPFEDEKYSGNINISILNDPRSSALYIRAIGERITLANFHGQYAQSLKEIFGESVVSNRDEVGDLLPIFGRQITMLNYGKCSAEEESEIQERIEKDAVRPYQGDMFTGYAILDNERGNIIGRISLGSGYEPGESQSGLIIHEDYKGKGYGKEAICLAAALAHVFYQQRYQVGDQGIKAPVRRFTATVLDTNLEAIRLITSIGMTYIRSLKPEENYSDAPRSLYGIEGERVVSRIDKLLDKSKITVSLREL